MSKLNVVRQIKLGKSNQDFELQKEIGWNNRFHLGKLPAYNAYNDTNYLNMKQLREQIRKVDKDGRKSATRMHAPAEIQFKKDSDSYNEEFNVVQTMWDDLGVTEEYRQIFDSLANEMEERLRKELFETEVSSLMRLSENLTKLSREVQSREKSLILLHKFDEAFSRSNEVSEKVINDMKQCVKNIRIQSINIVNHFNKIREICSYEIIGGKFDLDKINKVYNFDRNYLIKMKFDLEFLKLSSLDKFFNISKGWDPFLQNLAEKKEGKISVEMNQDMQSSIKNCQFLIIQDIIFYQLALKTSQPQDALDTFSSSRSPNKYKLNYPLAKRGRLNSPPLRPTSSNAYGYYNLNLNKNNRQYNSLFFTKEAINSIPVQKNKRIQIETKEKGPKTIDNFKTFQQNINKLKENQITHEKNTETSRSAKPLFNYITKNNENTGNHQTKETHVNHDKRDSPEVRNISQIPDIDNQNSEVHADHNYSENYNFDAKDFDESQKETKIENEKISEPNIVKENKVSVDIKENNHQENLRETSIIKNQEDMEEDIKYDFGENLSNLEKEQIINHNVNNISLEQKSQIKNNPNESLSTHQVDEEKQRLNIQNEIKYDQEKIMHTENTKKINLEYNFAEKFVAEIIEEDVIDKPNENEISKANHLADENNKSHVEERIVYKKLHNDEEDDFHLQSKTKELENASEIKTQVNDFISNILTSKSDDHPIVELENKNQENLNKPDTSPLKIEFFNKNLKDFYEQYEDYFKSIPEEQKICFKPSKDIHTYLKGINPKIITAFGDSDLKGICFVNYECYSNTIVRISINQITTKETSKFEEIFKIFVDKIFSELKCDEIMIDIHYQFIDGTFKMNKDIFGILKEKMGFKWSHLENKTAMDRLQKMCLKKPHNVVDLSIKNSLYLSNATNLIVSQEEKKEILENIEEKNVNAFMLIYSLVELENSDFVLENEYFNKFDFTKLKNLCKEFILSSGNEADNLESHLKTHSIKFDTITQHPHSLLLTLEMKFSNVLTSEVELEGGKKFLYNRIDLNVSEALVDPETSQIFYLISSGDDSNSILVAQLNENFKTLLRQSQKNLSELFFEKYPRLENVPSESKHSFIWLPCFSNSSQNSYPHPKLMSDVLIKKNSENYHISLIEEYKNFKLLPDKLYSISPNLRPQASDILIQDLFLVSIVNLKLISELGIPSMYIQLVHPEMWTKI